MYGDLGYSASFQFCGVCLDNIYVNFIYSFSVLINESVRYRNGYRPLLFCKVFQYNTSVYNGVS